MHYKNRREAKNGDSIVWLTPYGPALAGILYNAVEGNDMCNGRIATVTISDACPNLADCLHSDDVKQWFTEQPPAQQ